MATPPELAKRLARVRQLTDEYKAGDKRSFDAVRNLADFLLRLTVLKPSGGVRLASIQGPTKRFVAGGWNGPDDPLPLNDGKYLRLAITLELVETKDGPRLKVFESSIQYQADRDGKDWIFRYDYLRYSPNPHPAAHLQIRGKLLRTGTRNIERIHFPTSRVSLEAIIRLLVQEFGVKCNEDSGVWRPVLAESERLFFEIAHIPLSVFPV